MWTNYLRPDIKRGLSLRLLLGIDPVDSIEFDQAALKLETAGEEISPKIDTITQVNCSAERSHRHQRSTVGHHTCFKVAVTFKRGFDWSGTQGDSGELSGVFWVLWLVWLSTEICPRFSN
ncbi:hypothetical protein R1flu_014938 [Riccia fluitans]|uniref:Uncharacterized protein n=1 Tax=Riccia fluitans TaxID=41844 RepID=A0ABD1YKN3_9MARC